MNTQQHQAQPDYKQEATMRSGKLTWKEYVALSIKANAGTQAAATYLKDAHGWTLEQSRELLCVVGRNVHTVPQHYPRH